MFQEKSLRKFEDTESDLPRLISQHMEDQRVLKARLRKAQDAERWAGIYVCALCQSTNSL